MQYFERIRELREENALTMKEVASYLNVSQPTYSDYEFDRSRIPVERLILLAKFYNVSMDYISGISNIRGHYPSK